MTSSNTMAFDNIRFFAPKTCGGIESGWEGWVQITVRGRREWLPAIDPCRSAVIVIDLQRECCDAWPEAIAKYDRELAETYRHRMNEVVLPNVARILDLFRREDMPVVFLTLDRDGIAPQIAPD